MITLKNSIQSSIIRRAANQPAPTVEGVVYQNTGATAYNGFPYPDTLDDNSIIVGWKQSATHADAGPYMLGRSVVGGPPTFATRQLTVGGVAKNCAALSLAKCADYVIVSFQDDTLYTSVKFARCLASSLQSNFASQDFTSSGTVNFLANYSSSPYGRPFVMPSGKIYQYYYSIGIGPNSGKCICGLIESDDNGATWAIGPTIYTETTPSPVLGNICSEGGVCIVETGASDATTKLVAYLRNETTAYYTQLSSTDGGTTWAADTVNFMYEFGDVVERMPVEPRLFGGLVYIIAGVRALSGIYTVQYTTCTPANALTNNQAGYSANVTLPYNANADTNGAAIDFGYALYFERLGELWCMFYDTIPVQLPGDRQCWIYQAQVV